MRLQACRCWLHAVRSPRFLIQLGIATLGLSFLGVSTAPSQANSATPTRIAVCPQSAISRFTRHTVTSGETLAGIARRYNLIPATLMGLNSTLREGKAVVGTQVTVPPFNGILVQVPAGQSFKDVAKTYGVRPDLLFEVNGCQPTAAKVFVPGVNWSPLAKAERTSVIDRWSYYPLPQLATVITAYGWQLNARSGKVEFHSGIDLAAKTGTPALAIADGIVAFSGKRKGYGGNLVVINHAQGRQTRYSELAQVLVKPGQRVQPGDRVGTVAPTTLQQPTHLHFEVRSTSSLGWVAQNPANYLKARSRTP